MITAKPKYLGIVNRLVCEHFVLVFKVGFLSFDFLPVKVKLPGNILVFSPVIA